MGRKGKIDIQREVQGFEEHPARCGNCRYVIEEVPGVHPRYHVPGVQVYVPPACSLGKFNVHYHSICDLWTDDEGNTLE